MTPTTRPGSRVSIPRRERSHGSSSCRTRRTAGREDRLPGSRRSRSATGRYGRSTPIRRSRASIPRRGGSWRRCPRRRSAPARWRPVTRACGCSATRTRWCGSTRAPTGPRPPIELGSNFLPGIAVGGGAVWASSEEGQLWRVEPGPRPLTRTIEVGAGVQYVAFGDGAVWAANWSDGTVARIDPATNAVTARIPVGATQALAAGAGSAWVSRRGGDARRNAARHGLRRDRRREAGPRTSSSHRTCRSRVVSPRSHAGTRERSGS